MLGNCRTRHDEVAGKKIDGLFAVSEENDKAAAGWIADCIKDVPGDASPCRHEVELSVSSCLPVK